MINGRNEPHIQNGWGIPYEIEPIQGKSYFFGLNSISEIQKWLESVNPHYIQASSSIIKQIDLSKITNYIDHKGSNEIGDSMYSSEECGTIAITCPDNPLVYHVMENQLVEVDVDGSMIITCKTNPYIKRYKHGDHIELGTCNCGRSLQTISKINGRVRNMFHMKNGDIKWPLIGSKSYDEYGIKRYKCIQVDLETVELHVVANKIENEEELKNLIKSWLSTDIDVNIVYVDSFSNYKHEEFITLIKK
jgi:phenylacetate-coenzyme A ligase PaaK-like adenylate-forming protein